MRLNNNITSNKRGRDQVRRIAALIWDLTGGEELPKSILVEEQHEPIPPPPVLREWDAESIKGRRLTHNARGAAGLNNRIGVPHGGHLLIAMRPIEEKNQIAREEEEEEEVEEEEKERRRERLRRTHKEEFTSTQ
jgi:hypothetical protein